MSPSQDILESNGQTMARPEQEGHEPTVCRRHQSGHREGRVLRHRVRPRLRRLLPPHGAQHPHVALRLTPAHYPSPRLRRLFSRRWSRGLLRSRSRGSLGAIHVSPIRPLGVSAGAPWGSRGGHENRKVPEGTRSSTPSTCLCQSLTSTAGAPTCAPVPSRPNIFKRRFPSALPWHGRGREFESP